MAKEKFWKERQSDNDNNLTIVVSNPCSHSMIWVRAMFARKDKRTIMCETGVLAYNKEKSPPQQKPELTEKLFEWGIPTFKKVKEAIDTELNKGNVVLKDTVFAAKHYINELQGIKSKSTSIFFLLRDPADGLVSNYKKLPIAMDENLTDAWSYEHMLELYDNLSALNKNTFLMDSSDILEQTEATMQLFCERANMEYIPDSLHWESLSEDQRELGPYCRLAPRWQDAIAESTGIDKNLSATKAKRDADGVPTFEEIPEQHRASYKEFYDQQMPYYLKLVDELKIQQSEVHANSCSV